MTTTHHNIEFIAREAGSFFDIKNKNSRLVKLLTPFRFLIDRLFRTDEFHKIYRVQGEAKVFQYK